MKKARRKNKAVNLEYLKIWSEIFIALRLILSKRKKGRVENGKVLIVVPCLIGEFAAAVPAIFDYIKRNGDKKVHLLVSPPVKTLAERISGVESVFVAASVHGRHLAGSAGKQSLENYEKIILLRISGEVYKILKNIEFDKLETALPHALKYVFHLGISLAISRRPKKWRTLNFEILGGDDRPIYFDDIFDLAKNGQGGFTTQNDKYTEKKKVIIHTGTNWPMKRWDPEKWVQLIERINELGDFRFICVGGKEDEANWDYISDRLNFDIECLINQVDIADLALLLRQADYFVGIDSGPANIAHLAGTKNIVLYGPGPHMFMSDHPEHIAIDKSNGRGLFQLYFASKKSYISRIEVDEVYGAFRELYSGE